VQDTILLISHSKRKDDTYRVALEKRYRIFIAHSGKQGIELARAHVPRVIVVDAVSMRTTGERICQVIKDELPHIPLIHIHPGPRKGSNSVADSLHFAPFTARRLVNSVGRLIPAAGEEEVVVCGPFFMNVARRILVVYGKETQLTPKQARLLEIFLRNPGKIMARKFIMEKVWQTSYLGDTRTLDVHIRWLRKVMENGSKKPRFLQTVRGVGYRLVIPNGDAV
jgi:DNA-binding response OmpR family regulator